MQWTGLLPIVERELRVAARRRGTYWSRVPAALLVMVVVGSFVLSMSKGMLAGMMGRCSLPF